MASACTWTIGDDGCLSIGEETTSLTYHSGLNIVIVCTKTNDIKVIDIPSGIVLRDCKLSNLNSHQESLQCQYVCSLDRVVYSNGRAIGIRKDLSGVLLLDTALQTPVKKSEDNVYLELLLPEANSLLNTLMTAELPGVDYVDDVIRELEKEVESAQQLIKGNHKQSKWSVVCVRLPHCALKTVCRSLVEELKRQNDRKPGLATAAAVFDRLQCLLPKHDSEASGTNGVVDRALMYSELARRETFSKWPHMNYKWALPAQMAQAGFYHQPAGTGDDRALCFTCNVCLVCWEPTDEPWSEHERHSPQCPFVKGEFTQNVACAASYAAEPANNHGNENEVVHIECISTSSSSDYIASSSIHGNIVVWDTSKQSKKHIEFNVDPWESIIASKTGTGASVHTLEPLPKSFSPARSPSPNGTIDTSSIESQSTVASGKDETDAISIAPPTININGKVAKTHISEVILESGPKPATSSITSKSNVDLDDKHGKAEVIEVGGAWKVTLKENSAVATSVEGDIVEIPLENEMPKQNIGLSQKRCRPSLDVLVSALCVLQQPPSSNSELSSACASAGLTDPNQSSARPCLVNGVAIRRNMASSALDMLLGSDNEEISEVQALNQVNQAITEDSQSQIISQNMNEISMPNPFVPYILVHDITNIDSTKPGNDSWKSTARGSNAKGSGSTNKFSDSSGPWKQMPATQSGSLNLVQQSIPKPQVLGGMYSPILDELDTDDEDGVQIIDVIAPPGTKNVSQHNFKFGSVPQLVSFNDTSKKLDSSGNQKNSSSGSHTPIAKATVKISKEGQVLQCIELPNQIGNDMYVRSITPTIDGRYVIVVVAPRCLNRKLELLSNNQPELIETSSDEERDTSRTDTNSASNLSSHIYSYGGYLLLYKVIVKHNSVMLNSQPEVMSEPLSHVSDAVINVSLLPPEAAHSHDDEETLLTSSSSACSSSSRSDGGPEGQIAVTTKDGRVKVLNICDFKVLATIIAPNDEHFLGVTYCSGIDRLCCCTKEGRLFFYTLCPNQNTQTNELPSIKDLSVTKSEDLTEPTTVESNSIESLLVHQPLSIDTLGRMYELTQYENLVPRFSATVPQCWNEIQQEQQQRRHPQHLHQHGEANKHTRTWKLQQDSSSWNEHVFEIVLPRPTPVGHVDLKFSLHPMCTSAPRIQVTLYKQKSSSFSRKVLSEEATPPVNGVDRQSPVDKKIDFKLGGDDRSSKANNVNIDAEMRKSYCSQLQGDCAEIVCGPLDLSSYTDMSGRSGIIALTSPQLMKMKTKTLLLHIKAHVAPKDQPVEQNHEKSTSKGAEDKGSKSKENSPQPGTLAATNVEIGKLSEAVIKQKLDSVKGCDWLSEISITIRKNKLTTLPNARAQRIALLETTTFHEQLLIVACGLETEAVSACDDYKKQLALDILSWILAVQVCDIHVNKKEPVSVLGTIQANLRGLVQAAYIESGRSLAHQCTKLITQCLDYTKEFNDITYHNGFTLALHSALLECLPSIPAAKSAGSLKWFFTLLNRVKLVDSGATGQLCTNLLSSVAQHYRKRHSALHSLLKTRYGLYGHPFDPELFDIDPPQQARSPSNGSPSTYAGAVGTGTVTPNNATSHGAVWSSDDFDSKELLSLANTDKMCNSSALNAKLHSDLVTRHVCGLLEVEPLHFTIHATSDGTKVERVDSVVGAVGSSAGPVSGLTGGTVNFSENVSSTAGAAIASLSSAMTTAEAEVQKLQQKQLQLLKLQQQKFNLEQKLAETSKQSSGATSNFSVYNSELFPPTPKNTPFFMTPPITPPNEAFVNQDTHIKYPSSKASSGKDTPQSKSPLVMSNVSNLFQAPPPQALVVERISSVSTLPGARRFVVLDFGKTILLSDVIIPACLDLASLSIDVWINSEESDGQRLVVTNDIGLKSLVLSDLSPFICCRYLKVTTIGRYGGNTTKSKIPIGSFYGHTFMLPWEYHLDGSRKDQSVNSFTGLSSITAADNSQILSQIGVYISLQEDIQCRYSLACNRLESLLTAIENPQWGSTHTQYYLKKAKKTEEDNKLYQAYHECMSLQLQLNVAQRAIERLQKAMGIKPNSIRADEMHSEANEKILKQASTDRLRVLCELLLDCVMSVTFPAVAHPPVSLYSSLTPALCEDLFKNLCVHGSTKMQMYTGLFLVRVCGCQAWWGRFLGNMLQQYFVAEQPHIFPQDRVFLLLVSLGQRSLTSNKSCEILESILMMLANILSPLIASQSRDNPRIQGLRSLDLTLIGWLLLFLSKCLDHVAVSPFLEGGVQKNGAATTNVKDIPLVQNRWDFLQGEAAMQNTKSSGKVSPSKMFRRKLQKRLAHTKHQLLEFQKAKVALDTQEKVMLEKAEKNMIEKAKVLLKSADSCIQQIDSHMSQEALKNQLKVTKDSLLKQYSSKHFKDLWNLRKNDAEALRKLKASEGQGASGGTSGSNGDKDPGFDGHGDLGVHMARERCIPVIRGLVALLLSMDFTCNVDLFIIASKVIARVTQLTKPAICLSEVVDQEELTKLIMLMCNIEYNNGNVSWGGAWAGHAITCLLQDILEGERLSPHFESGLTGITDDEALASSTATTISETDESLPNSTTLPSTVDDEASSQASLSAVASKDNLVAEGENNNTMSSSYNDAEKDNWLEMILAGQEPTEDLFPFKAKDLLPPLPGNMSSIPKPSLYSISHNSSNPFMPPPPTSFGFSGGFGTTVTSAAGKSSSGTKNLGAQSNNDWWQSMASSTMKKLHSTSGGTTLTDYLANKAGITTACGQGVSTAIDVRLEYGLEMPVEMKLRLMMTMEALRVHNALTAPIPHPSSAAEGVAFSSCQQTDDEQITEATLLGSIRQMQVIPSSEMLSCCFNDLFMQLPMQRINLDSLLQVWLTLNEDTTHEENGVAVFDSGKVPSLPLSAGAVTSLLTALSWAPSVPVRTWVLAFQVLSLVINQKPADPVSSNSQSPRDGTSTTAGSPSGNTAAPVENCMATLIVSNSNLRDVLVKFLSGTSVHGPAISSSPQTQIGPTATNCFYLFLLRMRWRTPSETFNNFKELLLKILFVLCSESTRGALHSHVGPQDAQCKLIEYMTELDYENIDLSNAISVIESITKLVYQHIIAQDRVVCRSSSENTVSARSCFGGLIGNVLRGTDSKTSSGGDCSRDTLMCGLLKLVNLMVQLQLPVSRGSSGHPRRRRATSNVDTMPIVDEVPTTPLTDLNKISQAFGEDSNLVTSTPASAFTDEEKRQQTDEQDDTGANASPLLTPRPQACAHFTDVAHPEREESQENSLGFIVLSHYQTIMHLIQALSSCSSNTMAMILGSSMRGSIQDTFACIDPISVGDGIFQILCSLNRKATDLKLILKPLHDYLSCSLTGSMSGRMGRLSEPLLWFMLRVLDCPHAIRTFMEMGGIQVLCESLVKSSKQVINTAPSLVSTMMCSLGATNKNSRKLDTDSQDQLINFAPLGTVSSSSPKAGPAEILIGATPPHRRARSAAFSYHFYPDEMWMDLTISLPCSIVLKEVHVQPHVSSLATCPSAVSLEVSRDGMACVPICAPQNTSGFTTIKLQLLKPEVVSAVTVRLHRPHDSSSVGLSQIRLMGNTAFGETGAIKSSNFFTPVEDYVSKTSVGWLRLLHHCLCHCDDVAAEVAAAAAPTPHLMATCTALLLSPSSIVYDHNIEQVLLKIGLHNEEIGLCLLDYLLTGTSQRQSDSMLRPPGALHGHRGGMANESTIDILYHLGVTQDSGTEARVGALCEWLKRSAVVALERGNSRYTSPHAQSSPSVGSDWLRAAPGHVQCVAVILWHSNSLILSYDLQALVSQELLRLLYEWSNLVAHDTALKQAIDSVICSMCFIQPQYYYLLLLWTGVLKASSQLTDDNKDERQHLGPLTDDSKTDYEAQRFVQPITDDAALARGSQMADLNHMTIDKSHLATLAMASQSPQALNRLLDTGFLSLFCKALFDFCTNELSNYVESLIASESMTDASKSASTSPRRTEESRSRSISESSNPHTDGDCLTAEQASDVLHFLANIAQEAGVKDWLGAQENSVFWSVLLNLLCTTPAHISTPIANNKQMLSSGQRSRLETETINFFKQTIACHQENQLRFATVLCDVMRTTGLLGQTSALSGFMRRLFLQVLLEDEKVLVCVHSLTQMYKGSSFTSASKHPRCGAGHKYRAVLVSLNSTCAEILNKISDTAALSDDGADKLGNNISKTNGSAEKFKMDVTEFGLQMVNNISQAAGLSAQEKRSKSTSTSVSDSLPPRPPSRRGHRSTSSALKATNASVNSGLAVAPALHLFHTAMPHQPLPGDLTLAQLFVILQTRGYGSAGRAASAMTSHTTFFQFKMKLRSKLIEDNPDDGLLGVGSEMIPDAVLLETSSTPSALQVFASVGGLSLLAEHLPVLYPEVSRVSVGTEEVGGSKSTSTAPSAMGHDWVTVESADEFYDDIYEPLPALSGQVGRDGKQMAGAMLMPTIPPHSLVSFGVFLRLPGYAEVLLKERRKAQCLLRLVLGVTDDGEGGHILSNSVASSLPTLPFTVLRSLCDSTPLSTDDGVLLRRMTLEIGVVHLLLACLSVLSHHAPRHPIPGFHQEVIAAAMQSASSNTSSHKTETKTTSLADEKNQQYWAKGTGFGTGSTISSWDAEQSMLRQRSEEEHVTCLIKVLASFINPGGQVPDNFHDSTYSDQEASEKNSLPVGFSELLTSSCLVPAICSYIRNDSVLDMSRHIPLYRALLELLRAISVCPILVHLLLPLDQKDDETSAVSIVELLEKMRTCVDTYASRLKSNKGKNGNNGGNDNGKVNKEDVEDSEGLALLIPDIQNTAKIVFLSSQRLKQKTMEQEDKAGNEKVIGAGKDDHSAEDKYLELMKNLQFDTFEMVIEDEDSGNPKFMLAYHYESNVKSAGDINNAPRARRLAQEAVTLSTSLPLSYNSTVFVRCDEERLDVMKVLITGPSDTPYGNGCFEFDVYFPQDYPNSPPLVNLETTGNKTVRFNPNLYNDGKVCLSVLNTWHGRPEEKWNAQTSSFLQVLVSIQSLILVSEPYFNEPGYERSRGTPSGTASSREYDANIRQATVKWAMLEMLRNPPACFKQVIQNHMWLKRHDICAQVETWIQEMEGYCNDKRTGRSIAHSLVALKRHYSQLREEFAKMKPPPELHGDAREENEPDICATTQNAGGSSEGMSTANGLCNNTPLSNSTSSTGTLSDSTTSSSTDSALSQEMNPTNLNKHKPSSDSTSDTGTDVASTTGVGGSGKGPQHPQLPHSEMNHVGTIPIGDGGEHHTQPLSNGEVSEDVASMFLGSEDEGGSANLNLQSTGDIFFL